MPIQQMLLGVGAATKTYVDDIFSTYVYAGNSTARSINNGLNLSGEGGMTWIKSRDNAYDHYIVDTERGALNRIRSNSSGASGAAAETLTAFNNNGFALGADSINLVVNASNKTYASWSFRKAEGFFDIVTYTGNGTAGRTVSHNLGCVPGMVIAKATDSIKNWCVYHRSLGATHNIVLDVSNAASDINTVWNDTEPTSTNFTVGTSGGTNENGTTYVAYVFAGGESTAATARSVEFDGATNGDALSVADFPNFRLNDFTVECWFYPHTISGGIDTIMDNYQNSSSTGAWFSLHQHNSGFYWGRNNANPIDIQNVLDTPNKWYHLAMVRNGTDHAMYLNGAKIAGFTETYDYTDGGAETRTLSIGRQHNSSFPSRQFDGLISNARIVIGTAVYTSSFIPPTEPLTNITNTTLLCCNNSSTTGSTVTPGTITTVSSPTASTDSPFDDPAGFVFGGAEDQGIIKTGSYVGNGSSTGPEINLGWEPQWVMTKNADSNSRDWVIWDSMRGMVTGGNDPRLKANVTEVEGENNAIDLTPTGFKIVNNASNWNESGDTIIYMAIRRPDGYVGKPPSLGTDVFTVVAGLDTPNNPNYVTNFVTDVSLWKLYESTGNWWQAARLTGQKYLSPDNTNSENTNTNYKWDFMNGWYVGPYTLSLQMGWHFKRHAGMDFIAYKGDGVAGKQIPHSLSKTPEMIWIKNSDRAEAWRVYHKGLNGGTTPHNYGLKLNTDDAESAVTIWNQTAPTSTHFTINADSGVNHDGEDMRAFLFASVDGISKVGYYDGSDSSQTITTGFQPRFLILKRVTTISGVNNPWYVLDTTRGWGSGDDKYLEVQTTGAQGDFDFGAPTSTGFTLIGNNNGISKSGHKYIYYAHA